ncbi:MAG: hypothetical protein ACWGQW_13690, partial [bacterium]
KLTYEVEVPKPEFVFLPPMQFIDRQRCCSTSFGNGSMEASQKDGEDGWVRFRLLSPGYYLDGVSVGR